MDVDFSAPIGARRPSRRARTRPLGPAPGPRRARDRPSPSGAERTRRGRVGVDRRGLVFRHNCLNDKLFWHISLGRIGHGAVIAGRVVRQPCEVRPRLLQRDQLPDRRPQRAIDRHLIAVPQLPLLRPVAVRRRHGAGPQVGRVGLLAPELAEPGYLLGHRLAQELDRRGVLLLRQREDDHAVAVVEARPVGEFGVVGRQQPGRGPGDRPGVVRVLVEPVARHHHQRPVVVRLVPAGGPRLQGALELAAGGDHAVDARGVQFEERLGAAWVGVGAGHGAVDAVEPLEVERVAGHLGAPPEPGALGLHGPGQPPRGDRGPLDEHGAGVALGFPVVEPGLALGLELGGVLAGEDDVLGPQAVLEAIELGDGLALGGGGAPGLLAVDSARFALLLGTHGWWPLGGGGISGWSLRAASRAFYRISS